MKLRLYVAKNLVAAQVQKRIDSVTKERDESAEKLKKLEESVLVTGDYEKEFLKNGLLGMEFELKELASRLELVRAHDGESISLEIEA